MQPTAQTFIDKEKALKLALQRVENKLAQFQEYAAKISGPWTDADREITKDWNNWHDLHDRITGRLRDNWSNYHDWHWDTHGFNVY